VMKEYIMQVQPYLFFNGRCEEALDFYQRVLGAEVLMKMRFNESPEPPAPGMVPEGSENNIMHTCFRIGDTEIMASDGCGEEPPTFQGFALSIAVASAGEADRCFNALADGGQVQMPMQTTFWSPRFGMVTDRFGIGWMVSVIDQQAQGT
jgi:PhnB protein